MSVTSSPWRLLRLLSPFVPVFRELAEISYLWHEPHRIDGERLKAAINPIPQTPFATAIAAALDDLGLMAAPRTPGRR